MELMLGRLGAQVCPYAYIASTRIDDVRSRSCLADEARQADRRPTQVARFTGADISWRPVLLGELPRLCAETAKARS